MLWLQCDVLPLPVWGLLVCAMYCRCINSSCTSRVCTARDLAQWLGQQAVALYQGRHQGQRHCFYLPPADHVPVRDHASCTTSVTVTVTVCPHACIHSNHRTPLADSLVSMLLMVPPCRPAFLSHLAFGKLDLGDVPLAITGIKTHVNDSDSVMLDMHMVWNGMLMSFTSPSRGPQSAAC